jgi:hypothetical protein
MTPRPAIVRNTLRRSRKLVSLDFNRPRYRIPLVSNPPILQYSNTPILQYSIPPIFDLAPRAITDRGRGRGRLEETLDPLQL